MCILAPPMRGELIASTGNAELTVRVEPDSGQWRVHIDGRELLVDAVRVKGQTWSLIIGGRSYLVDVDDTKSPPVLHTHQAATSILLESAQRKRLAEQIGGAGGGKAKGETIKAPIAGRVVKLLCEVGDVIEPGQGVIVLEAMKMENEIKSERGGVVSAIHVEAAQSVETNGKLLVLSPPPSDES